MTTDNDLLQQKVEMLERDVATLKRGYGGHGVRKQSPTRLGGLPLYDISLGSDPTRGEIRGHARGVIAIGDLATGILAFGGIARGFVAVGGVALGVITVGGCSIGVLLSIGGLAIGSLAIGGGAVGLVAVGGGALGYYACGGGAFGQYVLNATQQDPEAVEFFKRWIPGIR